MTWSWQTWSWRDKYGLDKYGLDKYGLDKHGLDKNGVDKHGLDLVLIQFWTYLPAVLDWLSILFLPAFGDFCQSFLEIS